jgi:hypothetical protein
VIVRAQSKRDVLWVFPALAGLSCLLSGCSIEGTRQRNEACLQTRECTAGLICSPDTSSGDNRLRCTDSLDGTLPVVDVPPAQPETGAPAQDAARAD